MKISVCYDIFLIAYIKLHSWLESFSLSIYGERTGEGTMKYNMQKEIYEQPEILRAVVSAYVGKDEKINIELPEGIERINIVASGSSYNCAGIGASLFYKYLGMDAHSEYSSEFIGEKNVQASENDLYIFISQSGETYDTLEALKMIKKTSAKTLCISNNEDSSIWNLCDYKILSLAGKEHSIASTKAVSSQLLCLWMVVLKLMQERNISIESELQALKWLPLLIKEELKEIKQAKLAAKLLASYDDIVVLGANSYYSLAKEGALKIKETSYINANAYPIGEFMHGHVAVLNKKTALIAIIDKENQRLEKKNLAEIRKNYNPLILTISFGTKPKSTSNLDFNIDAKTDIERVFVSLIIFQLIAFETAKKLKRDIDKPKGLKKVVSH